MRCDARDVLFDGLACLLSARFGCGCVRGEWISSDGREICGGLCEVDDRHGIDYRLLSREDFWIWRF